MYATYALQRLKLTIKKRILRWFRHVSRMEDMTSETSHALGSEHYKAKDGKTKETGLTS